MASTTTRIGLFAVGLAVILVGAFAVGATWDPDTADDGEGHGGEAVAHADGAGAGGPARLVVEDGIFEPGVRGALAFASSIVRDARSATSTSRMSARCT